jgi:hypothetical protein
LRREDVLDRGADPAARGVAAPDVGRHLDWPLRPGRIRLPLGGNGRIDGKAVDEPVEDRETAAPELGGEATYPARSRLGLELVDDGDRVEEPAACALADAGPGDGDRRMRPAGAGAADVQARWPARH